MTPEQIQTLRAVTEKAVKVAQALKVRNDQLRAANPTADDVTATVEALIKHHWLEPAHKEAAIKTLQDPKQALATLHNLAQSAAEAIARTENREPGRPVTTPNRKEAAAMRTIEDDYRELDEDMARLMSQISVETI